MMNKCVACKKPIDGEYVIVSVSTVIQKSVSDVVLGMSTVDMPPTKINHDSSERYHVACWNKTEHFKNKFDLYELKIELERLITQMSSSREMNVKSMSKNIAKLQSRLKAMKVEYDKIATRTRSISQIIATMGEK